MDPSAGPAAIRRAFLALSKRWHPDRGGDAAVMARICAARDEMSNARFGPSDSESSWEPSPTAEEERRQRHEHEAQERIRELLNEDAAGEARKQAAVDAKRSRKAVVQLDLFGVPTRAAAPKTDAEADLPSLELLLSTGELVLSPRSLAAATGGEAQGCDEPEQPPVRAEPEQPPVHAEPEQPPPEACDGDEHEQPFGEEAFDEPEEAAMAEEPLMGSDDEKGAAPRGKRGKKGKADKKDRVKYAVREELINVAWIKAVGGSDAAKQVLHGCTVRRWLGIFLARAVLLAKRRGAGESNIMPIVTAWRDMNHHVSCRGRRVSGVRPDHPVPLELAHEHGIPDGFVGLSAFGTPKVIKTILRAGLLDSEGALLCADIDQVAAHHKIQAQRVGAGPERFPHAWEYSQDPQAKRAELREAVKVSADNAKIFFVMCIYGAGLARWDKELAEPAASRLPAWFLAYHREQARGWTAPVVCRGVRGG